MNDLSLPIIKLLSVVVKGTTWLKIYALRQDTTLSETTFSAQLREIWRNLDYLYLGMEDVNQHSSTWNICCKLI